ncbi:apiosidase-like domain-containing protein [Dactylosporangium matsuzakiense]|uniref:Beta-glucosidase n=1 Tax=Dactylosporangium matsuzakiense TaxID=53360 RepID=A0A9W6KTM2_9ACTN|nr:DUF4038 domain-containing protein [Dactylosporangium matsuzakiense]UWZ42385.1 DUF4038 domain-containing protein [Dactylosporangium matsuzakiense]GLL07921.1 beta-glucosidase [Dactylosporangium matsuzakiense]
MHTVTIDPNAPRFLIDGAPAFLLADTLWAAFVRPTEQEWVAYLRLRRRQGFNAVNINVLPIPHDRSAAPGEREPFAVRPDGSWDFDAPDPAYLANARRMLETAVEHGMVPILVVLWCNFVPGTWGAALTPGLVMTEEQTAAHVDRVVDAFADLGVVFAASGDENFTDPQSTDRYASVLRRLRDRAPDNLRTLHPAPFVTPPAVLADGDLVDFYGYQAGHDDDWSVQPVNNGDALRRMPVRRPIVSMEPVYEGHGYGKGRGRHTAANVRLASWTSVLAGSGAGLGYGAHGVWPWHRPGEPFSGEHFSGTPFPADVALRFDGAWDVGLLRRIVEEHDLWDLQVRPELVVDDRSGACFAVQDSPRRAALYLPHPFAVTLDLDLSAYRVSSWNLGARNRDHPVVRFGGGRTVVEQPEYLADTLVLFSG